MVMSHSPFPAVANKCDCVFRFGWFSRWLQWVWLWVCLHLKEDEVCTSHWHFQSTKGDPQFHDLLQFRKVTKKWEKAAWNQDDIFSKFGKFAFYSAYIFCSYPSDLYIQALKQFDREMAFVGEVEIWKIGEMKKTHVQENISSYFLRFLQCFLHSSSVFLLCFFRSTVMSIRFSEQGRIEDTWQPPPQHHFCRPGKRAVLDLFTCRNLKQDETRK